MLGKQCFILLLEGFGICMGRFTDDELIEVNCLLIIFLLRFDIPQIHVDVGEKLEFRLDEFFCL
jgi:hypothetical protein